LVPSETAVIALGVATAGSTDPRIAVLVVLAACGAFLGDNATYLLGRRFGPTVAGRVFAGQRGARRRVWAERSLGRFGTRIIIGCRFIPGGRTAVTLSCGLIGYPRRRFIAATACAAVLWASYAFLIGRLGGKAFEDRPWAGLLLALGLTVLISAMIEVVRRAQAWQRRRAETTPPPSSAHHKFTAPDCAAGAPLADGADVHGGGTHDDHSDNGLSCAGCRPHGEGTRGACPSCAGRAGAGPQPGPGSRPAHPVRSEPASRRGGALAAHPRPAGPR
jgi:membrane protein DedA with SNARE-associated domain